MLEKIIAEIIQEQKGFSPEAVKDLIQGYKEKGKSLASFLIEKGVMDEEGLLSALAERLRVSYLKDLEAVKLDPSLVSKVPIAFSKKFKVVPVKLEGGVLTVATLNPLNYEPMDDLRVTLGCKEVRAVLSSEHEILRAINRFYEQSALRANLNR